MSWIRRFRRRVRIAPGARLNLGKRAASLSLGVRGAHVTVGPRGRRVTVGVPGTGLSATKTIGGTPHARIAGSSSNPVIANRQPGTGDVIAASIAALIVFVLLRWHGDTPLPAFLVALAVGAAVGVRRHRIGAFVLLIGLFYLAQAGSARPCRRREVRNLPACTGAWRSANSGVIMSRKVESGAAQHGRGFSG